MNSAKEFEEVFVQEGINAFSTGGSSASPMSSMSVVRDQCYTISMFSYGYQKSEFSERDFFQLLKEVERPGIINEKLSKLLSGS